LRSLAGNRRARRVLAEAAWAYRYPARVGEPLKALLENLPKAVCDIAWKAQIGLCFALSPTKQRRHKPAGRESARSQPSYGRSAARSHQCKPDFAPPGRTGRGGGATVRNSSVARLRPNRLLPNAVC
jgi:hypothetical protein